MAWTIKGDADVTVNTTGGVTYGLNATERSFDELGISSHGLKYQSLADDTFTYTVRTRNAKGLGTIVPKDGQELHFYLDGVRKFKGHVVAPKLGLKQLTVTAQGPWWWMGKIPLSGVLKDKTGASAERTSYVLPTQNLRASLRALINRAVDKGVPMARITDANESERISAMYPMLKMTLSNMSFAAAFAEVMACVPDAVAWFDYSVSPPALNVTRRAGLSSLSYAVGGTGAVRVESADIYPRLDQKVTRVELKSLTRQTKTGYPKWASQAAGSDIAGKVQIVTISGPETVQIMPKNDFDKVTLLTQQAILSLPSALVLDPVLADAVKKYGKLKYTDVGAGSNYPGWHRVVSGETAEWLRKDYGMKTKDLRINGWVAAAYNSTSGSGGHGKVGSYLKSIGRMIQETPSAGTGIIRVLVDYTIKVISISYPKKTVVRKKWDHDFINPPDGLAANLQGAQNWLPWDGQVTIARADLSGSNLLHRSLNLTNSHPDHADMDAMLRAVSYDFTRHRVTFELGAPARIDAGGLVNKMRRSPQDNIVWL